VAGQSIHAGSSGSPNNSWPPDQFAVLTGGLGPELEEEALALAQDRDSRSFSL